MEYASYVGNIYGHAEGMGRRAPQQRQGRCLEIEGAGRTGVSKGKVSGRSADFCAAPCSKVAKAPTGGSRNGNRLDVVLKRLSRAEEGNLA